MVESGPGSATPYFFASGSCCLPMEVFSEEPDLGITVILNTAVQAVTSNWFEWADKMETFVVAESPAPLSHRRGYWVLNGLWDLSRSGRTGIVSILI